MLKPRCISAPRDRCRHITFMGHGGTVLLHGVNGFWRRTKTISKCPGGLQSIDFFAQCSEPLTVCEHQANPYIACGHEGQFSCSYVFPRFFQYTAAYVSACEPSLLDDLLSKHSEWVIEANEMSHLILYRDIKTTLLTFLERCRKKNDPNDAARIDKILRLEHDGQCPNNSISPGLCSRLRPLHVHTRICIAIRYHFKHRRNGRPTTQGS
ncbi:uncharacterized protein EDB91DRAFT_338887 [Suillus paluster]|uniref:uncharacterized protein n=1 Tax=Suillus paluster TaxID=48578 RepID=UPI001B878A85|nr:uncharacterized protein EDB91DRAFT_338887 [Suillus paluster]KAG1740780.1 hypothetical protein EDB91DRAFT_338887 [Suillus paluster]